MNPWKWRTKKKQTCISLAAAAAAVISLVSSWIEKTRRRSSYGYAGVCVCESSYVAVMAVRREGAIEKVPTVFRSAGGAATATYTHCLLINELVFVYCLCYFFFFLLQRTSFIFQWTFRRCVQSSERWKRLKEEEEEVESERCSSLLRSPPVAFIVFFFPFPSESRGL